MSAFQPEEKSKFDGIFESLAPVNGLLSGEKVKPVLMNSKLPVDVLGKVNCSLFFRRCITLCVYFVSANLYVKKIFHQVWDLSDIDKDGHLDKDEFAVVRNFTYLFIFNRLLPCL